MKSRPWFNPNTQFEFCGCAKADADVQMKRVEDKMARAKVLVSMVPEGMNQDIDPEFGGVVVRRGIMNYEWGLL